MLETQSDVGVVGAGAMGTEIAFVFAQAGFRVTVHDAHGEKLQTLRPRLTSLYEKGVKRGFYPAADQDKTIGAIRIARHLEDYHSCHMVTEAVFEQQEVKADVLRKLDHICRTDCIIATNTSTIPISVLASYVSEARQPQVIGTHYFSPVSRMKLVEVIPGPPNQRGYFDKDSRDHVANRQSTRSCEGRDGVRGQQVVACTDDRSCATG